MSVTAISAPPETGLLRGIYRPHMAAVEKSWDQPLSALTPQTVASYLVIFGSAAIAGYLAGRILGIALIPVRR